LSNQCHAGKQKACVELRKIAESKNRNAILAINSLMDQTLLANLDARGNRNASLAVTHLTDQALLASVALENKSPRLRKLAVERLNDQKTLAGIAANDEDADVRRVAVAKLADRRLLARIATGDRDAKVRDAAAAAITHAPPNEGLYVRFIDGDGSSSGRLMLGRTDGQASYLPLRYGIAWMTGEESGETRTTIEDVQIYKVVSIERTSEGDLTLALMDGTQLALKHVINMADGYVDTIFRGLTDGSIFAKNQSNKWRKALFEWAEPLPLPARKGFLEGAYRATLPRHRSPLDNVAMVPLEAFGTQRDVSFQDQGLLLDTLGVVAGASRIVVDPRTWQCTATVGGRAVAGRLRPEISGIRGWVKSGKDYFPVAALGPEIESLEWVASNPGIRDEDFQESWDGSVLASQNAIWEVEDTAGRYWRLTHLAGYQEGDDHTLAPPGKHWVVSPGPDITTSGPVEAAPIGGTLAALDWNGATIFVPLNRIQTLDLQSRTAQFTAPLFGETARGLLGFGDQTGFGYSAGNELNNPGLRQKSNWKTVALEGTALDGRLLSFSVENVASVKQVGALAGDSSVVPGSPDPRAGVPEVKLNRGDLRASGAKLAYAAPDSTGDAKSIARWLILGVHHRQAGLGPIELNELIFSVDKGPLLRVSPSQITSLQREGNRLRLELGGLGYVGELLPATVLGTGGGQITALDTGVVKATFK
jgi:hypothetical protein